MTESKRNIAVLLPPPGPAWLGVLVFVTMALIHWAIITNVASPETLPGALHGFLRSWVLRHSLILPYAATAGLLVCLIREKWQLDAVRRGLQSESTDSIASKLQPAIDIIIDRCQESAALLNPSDLLKENERLGHELQYLFNIRWMFYSLLILLISTMGFGLFCYEMTLGRPEVSMLAVVFASVLAVMMLFALLVVDSLSARLYLMEHRTAVDNYLHRKYRDQSLPLQNEEPVIPAERVLPEVQAVVVPPSFGMPPGGQVRPGTPGPVRPGGPPGGPPGGGPPGFVNRPVGPGAPPGQPGPPGPPQRPGHAAARNAGDA